MNSHINTSAIPILQPDLMNRRLPVVEITDLAVAPGRVDVDEAHVAGLGEGEADVGDDVALQHVGAHVEHHGAAQLQAVELVDEEEAIVNLVLAADGLVLAALDGCDVLGELVDVGELLAGVHRVQQGATGAGEGDIEGRGHSAGCCVCLFTWATELLDLLKQVSKWYSP